MKKLFLLLLVFFPSSLKIPIYRIVFKWEIHQTAKIGFSVLLCDHLILKQGSVIGSLTVVKGISLLQLDEKSILGSLNWVSGFPLVESKHFDLDASRNPKLHIKCHGAVTSRHIIDCTDSVTIGRFATFAGFRSQILTHSINLKQARQRCSPVEIGDYCFIGTRSVLLPGAKVPSKSILAAGSVLSETLVEEGGLYGGVPARLIKKLELNEYPYMNRTEGYIW
ncbi:MAG: acyltransferase [Candidatus Poseidoniia archaeon]|jgi:serine acetyltransferase|nr:acyltransferase [Candidatus Poseidoniia archaeon]